MKWSVTHSNDRGSVRGDRRGAVIPLVAVFLVVFVVLAAFAVDVAYMQLVQTQLRAATDAAAKATTSALMQGKTDNQAVAVGIAMAAQNKVAGKPLVLAPSDIVLGQSQLQGDGSWKFVPNVTPSQASQVTSSLSANNANGAVNLFFAPAIGGSTFTPSTSSVASAFACEVCLVLDRSHSMCFDNTGELWKYPLPINLDWVLGIKTKPVVGSRWIALDGAIQNFCNILMTSNAPPRVAVVTWASEIGKNTTEFQLTGQTSPEVAVDLGLSTNMTSVYNAVKARSNNVMLGGTNMSVGMDKGIEILTANNVKPYAKKIMILMTDGQWNAGRDPVLAAQDAKAQNITIHAICFLQGADQTTPKAVANITGGKFYYAGDAASLQTAFEDLAYSLPVVLTK